MKDHLPPPPPPGFLWLSRFVENPDNPSEATDEAFARLVEKLRRVPDALAANRICQTGGNVVVADGQVIAEMKLPIAGLMTEVSGKEIAAENEAVRAAVSALGVTEGIEPFMNMAFVSLPVIPSVKMTTQGLVDVNKQERISLYYNT